MNYTEIHAVHFRGQFWYQIIPIMQMSSSSGWFLVVPEDHGEHICFPWCRLTESPGLLCSAPGQGPTANGIWARDSLLDKEPPDLFFELELKTSCNKQPSPETCRVCSHWRSQRPKDVHFALALSLVKKWKKPRDISVRVFFHFL